MNKHSDKDYDELARSVRAYCLQCSGGARKQVDECPIKHCPLYVYRRIADAPQTSSKSETAKSKQIAMDI